MGFYCPKCLKMIEELWKKEIAEAEKQAQEKL
jgi:hypothetical protein